MQNFQFVVLLVLLTAIPTSIILILYFISCLTKRLSMANLCKNKEDTRNNVKSFYSLKKSKIVFVLAILGLLLFSFYLWDLLCISKEWKTVKSIILFIVTFCFPVVVLCDYYYSQIMITDRIIFLRCFNSLFRPVIIDLSSSNNMKYDTFPRFFFISKYCIRLVCNSSGYVFATVANREDLISRLDEIYSKRREGE